MRTRNLPSQERICEVLSYDSVSGILRWKIKRPLTPVGSVAGSSSYDKKGGKIGSTVSIDGVRFPLSNIIWVMIHGDGSIPEDHEIDHKNRDPHDNRLDNLRLATRSQNAANRVRRTKSGRKGISITPEGRYWARICKPGGLIVNLGTYDSVDEAEAVYRDASLSTYGEFSRCESFSIS